MDLCIIILLRIILLLFFTTQDTFALRNVMLTIHPRIVQFLNDSTLQCSYDLEDDILYSVKWYRGRHEFYRYTPSEHPATKVFPIGSINVDTSQSNSTQVVLKSIDFNLSGNFTCEVTTDSPNNNKGVETQSAVESMLVVQLPEFPPKISVEGEPFDHGDILKANCTSPPSRPPVLLKFLLNDIVVSQNNPVLSYNIQEKAWSDLILKVPITNIHFSEGRLVLRCVANLMDIYYEEAKLELKSVRNPEPQRVTGFNEHSASGDFTISKINIILCLLIFIVLH